MVNWYALIGATLVPSIVGFIWYNKKVFGQSWMTLSGLTEEKLKETNMAKIMIFSLILSFLLAFILQNIVIHQFGIYSLLANEPGMKDPNSPLSEWLKGFMNQYGGNFRTFKHGAFHGTLTGIFIVMPILVMGALFERKSMKLTFIHVGYWTVTLAIMGAIICHIW